MKLIIECTEHTYSECKKISGLSETAFVIANGIPYNPTGDCISREALIREIGRTDEWYKGRSICNIIDNAPTVPQINIFCENADETAIEDMKAELQNVLDSERPKGEWSQYNFHDLGAFGDWDYKCSKCNKVNRWKANFCPNCGADMRGGAE